MFDRPRWRSLTFSTPRTFSWLWKNRAWPLLQFRQQNLLSCPSRPSNSRYVLCFSYRFAPAHLFKQHRCNWTEKWNQVFCMRNACSRDPHCWTNERILSAHPSCIHSPASAGQPAPASSWASTVPRLRILHFAWCALGLVRGSGPDPFVCYSVFLSSASLFSAFVHVRNQWCRGLSPRSGAVCQAHSCELRVESCFWQVHSLAELAVAPFLALQLARWACFVLLIFVLLASSAWSLSQIYLAFTVTDSRWTWTSFSFDSWPQKTPRKFGQILRLPKWSQWLLGTDCALELFAASSSGPSAATTASSCFIAAMNLTAPACATRFLQNSSSCIRLEQNPWRISEPFVLDQWFWRRSQL